MTGLARAFLQAGARGMVCSLWVVDDDEADGTMAGLYRGLADGDSTADALQRVKLTMIRARAPPARWAPFILIGE